MRKKPKKPKKLRPFSLPFSFHFSAERETYELPQVEVEKYFKKKGTESFYCKNQAKPPNIFHPFSVDKNSQMTNNKRSLKACGLFL